MTILGGGGGEGGDGESEEGRDPSGEEESSLLAQGSSHRSARFKAQGSSHRSAIALVNPCGLGRITSNTNFNEDKDTDQGSVEIKRSEDSNTKLLLFDSSVVLHAESFT